jgi:transcriptional regulator with XRE-family HTH domain
MDDVQVGSVIRAVRIRRGLSQVQLAVLAGVSPSTVSLIERGHLDRAGVRVVRHVAAALEIALPFAPRWRGSQMARLLDERHAHLVGRTVASLSERGWIARPELTFSMWGERGSIDVLGLQPDLRAALVVECKSVIVDLQDLLSTLDRKRRLAPAIVEQEWGWQPATLGCVLVVPETSASRAAVARHAGVFDAVLPARTVQIRTWLHEPSGRVAGIWFLRICDPGRGKRIPGGPLRVAAPRSVRDPAAGALKRRT